jgi:hypothetical protein
MSRNFLYVKEGDVVTRMLSGVVPMKLRVTKVDDILITCGIPDGPGGWTFDRITGIEEDHDLQWGIAFGYTGSFLVHEDGTNEYVKTEPGDEEVTRRGPIPGYLHGPSENDPCL